ncbi:hypothetical protein LMG22037_02515 [Paraburkholderia phenoliruptrix]|uniref:Uncharacterized protein n=1 Tax=Paraburkholderia phenoliruptrix TaxID=252970 RepID=A0A6J5AWW2_9BURK|nr:hypothetical protein LMG22037_02515 [Paraburkholderia phenoliruptrix]
MPMQPRRRARDATSPCCRLPDLWEPLDTQPASEAGSCNRQLRAIRQHNDWRKHANRGDNNQSDSGCRTRASSVHVERLGLSDP